MAKPKYSYNHLLLLPLAIGLTIMNFWGVRSPQETKPAATRFMIDEASPAKKKEEQD